MKVMVCFDGADASKAAFNVATEYAKVLSASVYVVTSLPDGSESGDSGASKRDELKRGLQEIKARTEGADVHFVTEAVGHDETEGENLVGYAAREGIDAIFIGVKKVSRVGKLLFGSTAQFVILSAPCPVISVKAGGTRP
jgi:nucleotide-binding universal stress UspA family protein